MTVPMSWRRRRPTLAVTVGVAVLLLSVALVSLSILARRPGYPVQPIVIAIAAATVGAVAYKIVQPSRLSVWVRE